MPIIEYEMTPEFHDIEQLKHLKTILLKTYDARDCIPLMKSLKRRIKLGTRLVDALEIVRKTNSVWDKMLRGDKTDVWNENKYMTEDGFVKADMCMNRFNYIKCNVEH